MLRNRHTNPSGYRTRINVICDTFKKPTEEDYHSVTQEHLSYIDSKLNPLFGQVTDDIVKERSIQ